MNSDNFKIKFQQNPLKFILIFFGIFIFIPIIITIVYFNFRPNKFGESVKIENLSLSVSGLSRDESDYLENQLYLILKKNNPNLNTKNLKANIIKNSIKNKSTSEVYSIDGTLDLPELKQAFDFSLHISRNGKGINSYPVILTCPKTPIYKEQQCQDNFTRQDEVVWENDYQLDYTLSRGGAVKFKQLIAPFILKDFKSSIKNKSLTVVIDESSPHRIDDEIYTFEAKVQNSLIKYTVALGNYGADYLIINSQTFLQPEISSNPLSKTIIANKKPSKKLKTWAMSYFKITDEKEIIFKKLQ